VRIWWGGLERNGDLMLLLAHLLTRNPPWREASVKLLNIASTDVMRNLTETQLRELIPGVPAEPPSPAARRSGSARSG
jgi:hypothetical protein